MFTIHPTTVNRRWKIIAGTYQDMSFATYNLANGMLVPAPALQFGQFFRVLSARSDTVLSGLLYIGLVFIRVC